MMGLKGLFEISKLLFQYSFAKNRGFRQSSDAPTLQYPSLKYFDPIHELES